MPKPDANPTGYTKDRGYLNTAKSSGPRPFTPAPGCVKPPEAKAPAPKLSDRDDRGRFLSKPQAAEQIRQIHGPNGAPFGQPRSRGNGR